MYSIHIRKYYAKLRIYILRIYIHMYVYVHTYAYMFRCMFECAYTRT